MKKILEWIGGVFDKDSTTSSKRVTGVLMVTWALIAASYYIWKSFHGGGDPSANSLIQFILLTGAGILTGGTVAENIGKKKKEKDEEV